MSNFTILEQPDPYDPQSCRFAVYGAIDTQGVRRVLSNHQSREMATRWVERHAPVGETSTSVVPRPQSARRSSDSAIGV